MFFFLIKKSFFDGWDNMIPLVLLNLVFTAILALGIMVPLRFVENPALGISIMVLSFLLFFLYSGVVSRNVMRIGNFKRPATIAEFVEDFKDTWLNSLLLGVVVGVASSLFFFAARFYLAQGNFISLLGGVFLFWVYLVFIVSLNYFFPAMQRLGNKRFLVLIKKCFILFFDNPLLSIGMAIYSVILFVLSLVLALFIPGFAGIMLLHSNAVRLLLFKYDYLEENPDANRKKIPWGALLMDEKERIGPRGLKDMIFPWKN